MPKMTIREELEMLRKEVEELKQKQEADDQLPTGDVGEFVHLKLEQAGEKIGEIEGEVKEQLEELAELLKKEYEHLSPVAAVFLFALGAVFGRAISSK